MTDARFYDAASGLLTREAFRFMVDHQLKHAQRAQEFLTLVVFVVERRWRELVQENEWRDRAVAADEWIVKEMARLIRFAVRSTDLLARTAEGTISLLLVGTDAERAVPVVDRLNLHLRRYRASPSLQISVGTACCPTDAVHAADLLRAAGARAVRVESAPAGTPEESTTEPRGDDRTPPPEDGALVRRVAYVDRRRAVANRKSARENQRTD